MRKMLLAAAALAVALAASAQEPKFDFRRDSTRTSGFTLPDSLAHMSPWKPDYKTMAPVKTKPSVSMTSVVVIQKENLPSRVTVIDNNTLRLGQHFTLSNGQAWNWSPFPDAFLDARTLSFPMPAVAPRKDCSSNTGSCFSQEPVFLCVRTCARRARMSDRPSGIRPPFCQGCKNPGCRRSPMPVPRLRSRTIISSEYIPPGSPP